MYLWLWARGPHSHTSPTAMNPLQESVIAKAVNMEMTYSANDREHGRCEAQRVKYLSERRLWKLSKREEQLPNI